MNSINKLLYFGEICTNLNRITDIVRSLVHLDMQKVMFDKKQLIICERRCPMAYAFEIHIAAYYIEEHLTFEYNTNTMNFV